MAKVTYRGPAKPDDPIYKSGPVVGGKRIGKMVRGDMKNIEVSKEEFYRAIDESLDINSAKPGSAGEEALSELLANVWDPGDGAISFRVLSVLDARSQQIAFTLLIGRTLHGRPRDHPESEKLLAFYYSR
jgi:hypothetical protein